jgi:hypothetical protein
MEALRFAVSDWAAVGGSQDAASYFKAIDDEGPFSQRLLGKI